MNNGLKYGLFFLGGLALGVVGTVAVTRGKLDLKPLATDMKDAIMSKVESVKEDMEDLAAEARQAADKRKAEAAEPQA